MLRFHLTTRQRSEMIDITGEIQSLVRQSGRRQGVCQVYVPHTTAAVAINENADPTVRRDILTTLEHLVPWTGDYLHTEGNSAAHIKAVLVGPSVQVPVEDGQLQLGTWQGIFFCEFDGPRRRQVWVTVLAANDAG